mgnify:CR=1 FL=1
MIESKVFMQKLDTSVLIDIFMDGVTTGIGSFAMTMTDGDEQAADKIADAFVAAMFGDPAVMETVRRNVAERLQGIEGSPHSLRIHQVGDGK